MATPRGIIVSVMAEKLATSRPSTTSSKRCTFVPESSALAVDPVTKGKRKTITNSAKCVRITKAHVSLFLLLDVLVQKLRHCGIANDAVGAFGHAVTLVGERFVLHGHALGSDRVDNLFGLILGNTRIIVSVDHEQRGFNVLH